MYYIIYTRLSRVYVYMCASVSGAASKKILFSGDRSRKFYAR